MRTGTVKILAEVLGYDKGIQSFFYQGKMGSKNHFTFLIFSTSNLHNFITPPGPLILFSPVPRPCASGAPMILHQETSVRPGAAPQKTDQGACRRCLHETQRDTPLWKQGPRRTSASLR